MLDSIFRKYDIRGKIPDEFDIDKTYELGCAIAYYFINTYAQTKTVAVGMDGRLTSPAIKQALCSALMDSGLDVIFVGVCPSPALYFAVHTLSVQAGLMITASHNGKEYNGIKIVLNKQVVWGDQITLIRDLLKEGKHIKALRAGSMRDHLINESYVSWLADHFADLKNMPLRVVIDCGNGAAASVMPLLCERMQWQHVELLCAQVDGTFPNHEADPVVEENMHDVKKYLASTDYQLGAGLDGDGDRMAAMTKKGYLVPGDKLLALFAQQVLQENPGATIVVDIKSSSSLLEFLAQQRAHAIICPSGHSIIKDCMKKNKALLAGELSCHFFFADRYFGYDDGIYSLLRLFEIIMQSGNSLEQLLEKIPHKDSSPEFRLACNEDQKITIIEHIQDQASKLKNADILTIDGVRVTLPYGWGIIRASNTQPVLSIRFEANSRPELIQIRDQFIKWLLPFYKNDFLQHSFTLK